MTKDQLQYEINSAINVCNGRIENGANIEDAFQWLNEETEQIFKGEFIYTEFPTLEQTVATDHTDSYGLPK